MSMSELIPMADDGQQLANLDIQFERWLSEQKQLLNTEVIEDWVKDLITEDLRRETTIHNASKIRQPVILAEDELPF